MKNSNAEFQFLLSILNFIQLDKNKLIKLKKKKITLMDYLKVIFNRKSLNFFIFSSNSSQDFLIEEKSFFLRKFEEIIKRRLHQVSESLVLSEKELEEFFNDSKNFPLFINHIYPFLKCKKKKLKRGDWLTEKIGESQF